MTTDGAHGAVDVRLAHLVGDVAALEEHRLESIALLRPRTLDLDPALAGQLAELGAILYVNPPFHRGQRQRAVHETGIDKGGTDPRGERKADGALSGARGAIDRDGAGRAGHRRRAAKSAATSRGQTRLHWRSSSPAHVSEPT